MCLLIVEGVDILKVVDVRLSDRRDTERVERAIYITPPRKTPSAVMLTAVNYIKTLTPPGHSQIG